MHKAPAARSRTPHHYLDGEERGYGGEQRGYTGVSGEQRGYGGDQRSYERSIHSETDLRNFLDDQVMAFCHFGFLFIKMSRI